MARSRKYELGVGCLLVAALLVLAFMALQVGALEGLGRRVMLEAEFADAAGLSPGAAVSVAGVQVGTVDSLRLDHDRAVVRLALQPEAQIRVDAKARVRARSVLGEKYVELEPGSRDAPVAPSGHRVQVAEEQIEIDQLVSLLAPLVEALDPEMVAEVAGRVGEALREDPDRIRRMLENADQALANVALASDELPALTEEGRAALAQTRRTLGQISARADESRDVLARADRVLADLEEASGDVPPLMADARAALEEARSLLATLDGHQDEIETILQNLSEIDRWELRRLLREEGILVRLRRREVVVPDEDDDGR